MTKKKTGRMLYVPPIVLDEVNSIMERGSIAKRADAFRELAKYSKVGREAESILKLDFSDTFKMLKKRQKR